MTLKNVKTFQQLIETIARKYKDRIALKIRPRFRAISWSYEELFKYSAYIARLLEKLKIKKGDKVLLWAPNSSLWVASFFGIQLKGAVVVPINIQNTVDFVKKILKQTEAKIIVKSNRLPAIKNVKTIIIEDVSLPMNSKFKKVNIKENDVAEIIYTSGTTGFPKGVILTHKNILSNVKASLEAIPVSSNDRFLSILPLSHMFEQVGGMLVPLAVGAQITYATALNSMSIRKNLIDDKVTKMLAVPEFLKLIIRRIESQADEKGKKKLLETLFKIARTIPLMSLRRILFHSIIKRFGKLHTIASGGAPLEKEIGEKWEAMGIYVLQGYGTTECSPVVTVNRYEDRKVDSVGKLISGVNVKIAEDEEVLVKGPNVTQGYFKNLQKTKDSFVDGWYRTGDAGYFDEDGHLHIKGRTKYMIVTEGGQNVYPEDIEFELNKIPDVEDSCVIGWKREDKLEIHAILLGKKIKNPEKIIANVNKKLVSFQQIQGYSIWPLDDFPRTVTKKVKKDEVLSYLEKISKGERVGREVKEVSLIEKLISQITGISARKITDNKKLVADLKMDSLDRVELVALIEEETGVIIDESDIGLRTTVKDIKNKVEKKIQKIEKYELKEWPLSPIFVMLRSLTNKILIKPIISYFAKTKVEGIKNLKNLELPALFFSNHISSFDTPAILHAMPDSIRERLSIATATDVIFERKELKKYEGFLTFLLNIYPFARKGQTKSSLEYTGRLIDGGFSILLFPEGRESRTGKLEEFKPGTGFVAVEMGVPVVPVKIIGTNKILPHGSQLPTIPKKADVIVRFGKPMKFSPTDSYIKATQVIQNAVERL